MTNKTQNNVSGKLRFPAEWERTGAVMVAWPHADTDWAYMLDEVQACYLKLIEAITRHATVVIVTPRIEDVMPRLMDTDADPTKIQWFVAPTNDTWTRDYGPLTTTTGPDDWQINDFCFNGWGLKFAADRDNLVTSRMFNEGFLGGQYVNRLGFVLEGGSIESDGQGTLLTTTRCLMSPNRNGDLTQAEISARLKEYFGAETVLWLDHGALEGDDTDSHIDTLARLAPNDTIIYTGTSDESDSHYAELREMKYDLLEMRKADGSGFHLLELPLPSPVYDEEGNRLPATYANYLVLNDAVLMPTYGQPKKDNLAARILKIAFPDHIIETVDCLPLVKQHGSLHCATMQLPYEILPTCPTPYVPE